MTHPIVTDLAETVCPSGECAEPGRIHTRDQYEECQHLAVLMADPGPPPGDLAWCDTASLMVAGGHL